MHSRILFIINRTAGQGEKHDLPRLISFSCAKAGLLPDLEFTRYGGHASELARQAVAEGYPRMVAVGGDGTVNEVAGSLMHTGILLGIVPTGSGNGLARHLRIPLQVDQALGLVQTGRTLYMDALPINDRFSFNVSGIGFDGLVAGAFGANGARGLRNYARIILREFPRFRNFRVTAEFEGQKVQDRVFIVAIANSSQFGSGAVVAPRASVCDGQADICLIRKPGWLQLPAFVFSMFTRQLDQSKLVQIFKTGSCHITMEGARASHLDGEPGPPLKEVNIKVEPACLKVMVPGTNNRV